MVISKFGEDTWHKIKEKANCQVIDGGFLRYKYYPDSDTVQLVVAAAEVLGISVDDVLHTFGDYFIDYVIENGYSNVLECLGSNLRDWLSNLNSLHDHLQASYPKGFVAPVFWSEDDPNCNYNYDNKVDSSNNNNNVTAEGGSQNAILVYYYSQRGSLLVPLVVGLLKKLAKVYFDIEIHLEQLTLQDEENGVPHTSWRVTTVDPVESYKLRGKKKKKKRSSIDSSEEFTVTTASTSATTYERTFQEGGAQAANLRVEELVKRSFLNPDCELHHALTLEQYNYLKEYWKKNEVVVNSNNHDSDETWCYDIWSLQGDDISTWPTLKDLPPKLNPATIESGHFGGQVPATGAFPPGEGGVLQTFPPKVRIINSVTQRQVDMVVDFRNDAAAKDKKSAVTMETAICQAPAVLEAKVGEFDEDPEVAGRVKRQELEVQWVIWNEETGDDFHIFTMGDLAVTTTQQLYDLVSGTNFDPITLHIKVEEAVAVDDDEEDI